jgi:hypothetical protein
VSEPPRGKSRFGTCARSLAPPRHPAVDESITASEAAAVHAVDARSPGPLQLRAARARRVRHCPLAFGTSRGPVRQSAACGRRRGLGSAGLAEWQRRVVERATCDAASAGPHGPLAGGSARERTGRQRQQAGRPPAACRPKNIRPEWQPWGGVASLLARCMHDG